MANTEIRRTSGSTPTDAEKFTLSLWFKKSKNAQSSERGLLGWRENSNSGNNSLQVEFQTTDKFQVQFISNNGNDTHINLVTNRQLSDTSAWYHLVIAVDSSQSTASDRAKIYFNGVQETSFGSATYPANGRTFSSNDIQINFGKSRGTTGSDRFFNGAMSHIHFIDGTQYQASDFGEYDANGVWKIKTSPSVTYGNNGFFWLKDDIAATDYSPNSNTWISGGGTLTKTEDNPSNVFATMNPLISQTAGVAGRNDPIDAKFFNGNTTIATSVAYWTPQLGNMEMFSGKYYWEQKFEVDGTPSNYLSWIGIEATDTAGTALGNPSGTNANGIAYGTGGVVNKSNSSQSGSWSTWTAGDIVMCAVDLDNNYIYFGKNGTWQNSGVPTSGGSGTGGVAVTTGKSYITASTIHRGGNYSINTTYSYAKSNFGNGYFGTTAVSSAGTNASGNGIFEYDVPTGFTALSTKGLNL